MCAGLFLKMSNYKKSKCVNLKSGTYDWTYILDCLYYNFIVNNKNVLSKIYATANMVKQAKNKENIKEMISIAKEYLKLISNESNNTY